MTKENKYMQYQYVVAYLQDAVQHGVKQKDLAVSIGKSNTYINWLVKDKRKKKNIEIQVIEKIANFFRMTVNELMMEGKKIYDQKNPKQIKDNNIREIHFHIHFSGFDQDHVVRV